MDTKNIFSTFFNYLKLQATYFKNKFKNKRGESFIEIPIILLGIYLIIYTFIKTHQSFLNYEKNTLINFKREWNYLGKKYEKR